MGPKERYLGPEVPTEELLWQDPIPAVTYAVIDDQDVAALKGKIRGCRPHGAAAGVYRLGFGLHLPRLRQARRHQRWPPAPGPAALLGSEQPRPAVHGAATSSAAFSRSSTRPRPAASRYPWPTCIVLAGVVGIEQAAKNAGHAVTVPFTPGRADASQEQTDVVVVRRPGAGADGFRNYLQAPPPGGRRGVAD